MAGPNRKCERVSTLLDVCERIDHLGVNALLWILRQSGLPVWINPAWASPPDDGWHTRYQWQPMNFADAPGAPVQPVQVDLPDGLIGVTGPDVQQLINGGEVTLHDPMTVIKGVVCAAAPGAATVTVNVTMIAVPEDQVLAIADDFRRPRPQVQISSKEALRRYGGQWDRMASHLKHWDRKGAEGLRTARVAEGQWNEKLLVEYGVRSGKMRPVLDWPPAATLFRR